MPQDARGAGHTGVLYEAAACLRPPYDTPVSVQQSALATDLAILSGPASETGPLFDALRTVAPAVCLTDTPSEALGVFDPEANVIAVSAGLGEDERRVILLHELRHVDQFNRGFCPGTDYSMTSAARFSFALEADAQAMTALIAWGAARNGEPSLWAAFRSFPQSTDIAQRLEDELAGGASPGAAAAAAFEQWYENPARVERYYIAACSDYLDRLDRDHLIPSDEALEPDRLAPLCLLPTGSPYPCDPTLSAPRPAAAN